MANITIVKLKVRRGSDAQRKSIVLDQGEVGYTLDTKRLYVGDGAKYGGNVVGNKNIGPYAADSNLGPDASPGLAIGDIGYANSLLYILTSTNYDDSLSGWGYIGPVPDDTLVEFNTDNKLTVKKATAEEGFDAQYLKSTFFGDGLLSSVGGIASVNLNSTYFEISNLKISPIADSITEREISTSALSSGLVGGNDNKLKLNINPQQFQFNSNNQLEFKGLDTTTLPTSSWAGQDGSNLVDSGLSLNGVTGELQADLRSVNSETFSLDSDGQISLFGATNTGQEFPFQDVTSGLVKTIQSSIYDVITATSLSGGAGAAGNSIPIGSIVPHARAFENIPTGYLLCDGNTYDSTDAEYKDLYDVIGINWNTAGDMPDPGGSLFRVPNLSGGDVMLYGNNASAPGANVLYLSGATAPLGNKDFPGGSSTGSLSAVGVNFIIKYKRDPINNIFNGAPNQKTVGYGRSIYDQQIYEGLDSSGNNIQLSSAGFITFANGGNVRNESSDEVFDRFAIPVYNW